MKVAEFKKGFDLWDEGAVEPIVLSTPYNENLHESSKPKDKPPVDKFWSSLVNADRSGPDIAAEWLSNVRGFASPRKVLGSGFANLTEESLSIFGPNNFFFIKRRLEISPQVVVPIRGVHSDKECNLFFRAISDVPKEEKTRLLAGAGGWSDEDGSPRAFGFPWLIQEFPNLVICEGMADYFAAECLLEGEEKYLPIGALNANSLNIWAHWLVKTNYKGRVIWMYQLDRNKDGNISLSATGQANAVSATKILKTAGIRSELFRWAPFLKEIPELRLMPEDLADLYSFLEGTRHSINEIFLEIISGEIKHG